ncbi:hypothetical protein BH18ACT16_BH18ACT16_14050 [soil metagenome]
MRRRRAFTALAGVLVLVSCGQGNPAQKQEVSAGAGGPGITINYPESWEVGPEEAEANADFPVWFPNTLKANAGTVTRSIMSPAGDEVIFMFPAKPSKVRQQHIEIFEAPWPADEDAESDWKRIAEEYPGYAKVIEVKGVVALEMTPYSPFDSDRANPALVSLEVKGVEVEVSGGDDLDVIRSIIEDIVEQATGE